jgi:hypothetical protein
MTRAEMLAITASATAAPSVARLRPAVTAVVTVQRDANALLAPFTVAIALDNTSKNDVLLDFPTADLFRVDVLQQDIPVWSSLTGHKPIPINRRIEVPPGVTKLASMVVDGTTDDRRAFAPGKYTLRVAMLGTSFGMVVDRAIDFAPPTPVEDVLQARPGTVFTIEGQQVVADGNVSLQDATATVRLSHALALRPSGEYVVRGFLDAVGDNRIFDVGRFAPAFAQAAPPGP